MRNKYRRLVAGIVDHDLIRYKSEGRDDAQRVDCKLAVERKKLHVLP